MDDELKRKIAERYGSAPVTIPAEFELPNTIEGGSGRGVTVFFPNTGKHTVYLQTQGGLWYESDAPELETYFAKSTEMPTSVAVTILTLNSEKHGVALPPTLSTEPEATLAEIGAVKHVSYLADPTPPDISPDLLDDGHRNADYSG